MTLQIKLENSVCRPGLLLDVTVVWEFDTPPSKLTLELSWRTSGKGTEDSETVYSEKWSPDSKSGKKELQIQLPRGPISVQGTLISIGWQLECTSKQPNASIIASLVLSQLDQPIRLTAVV